MNADSVILNEIINDGNDINAYYSPSLGGWLTYGYSAYLVMLKCREEGLECMQSFSMEMHMPCVTINKHSLQKVVNAFGDNTKLENESLGIKVSGGIDKEAYRKWVLSVK